ncbi:MAG: prepilin-type N-terminal cleavage/methylation domain-containing protein [Desulfuromonadaceae bacterium]|nr:prepilin-type N-terminal cleavage/methylation domain-containing protein [Desulfuromonadaceae bacterium]
MICENKQGYTLIELIIVMAIFMTVIMISSAAFERIVYQSSQQSKSVETQIEGIVGLEIMRADLQQAGFGLPWSFSSGVAYQEASASTVAGVDPSTFNDGPGNPPRAFVSGNSTFNSGADGASNYLVIKSILAAANGTSKKWTTVSFDKDDVRTRKQWGAADRDFTSDDHVIIVKNSLTSTPVTRELAVSSAGVFSGTFAHYSSPATHHSGDTFEIYGVSSTDLRMPFNRADYYISTPPKMPATCASQGVGILYKAIVNQGDGNFSKMPLLDCVADMQVVYGLDASGNGMSYSDPNYHTSDISGYDAAKIRDELKEIRVYILAQEGKKDRFYSYPSQTVEVGERFGGVLKGRNFDLLAHIGADYKQYRWKVYTIVIRPKNLIQ